MEKSKYEKFQSKIFRPNRLCLHCGRCMPIIDGDNMDTSEITSRDIRGPLNIWDEYPEECGYTGWLFYEREKQKHFVRKIKEELHVLSFFNKNDIVAKNTTAEDKIKQLEETIADWNIHGAKDW